MSLEQITVSLPEKIYRQVQQRSQQSLRSVADELVAMVAASLPDLEPLPVDLQEELAQLDLFTDEELWRAAQMTAPTDKTMRMQDLVEKQQLEGLTASEQAEAELLSRFFNRIMLVRAKATVVLQVRGQAIDRLVTD